MQAAARTRMLSIFTPRIHLSPLSKVCDSIRIGERVYRASADLNEGVLRYSKPPTARATASSNGSMFLSRSSAARALARAGRSALS